MLPRYPRRAGESPDRAFLCGILGHETVDFAEPQGCFIRKATIMHAANGVEELVGALVDLIERAIAGHAADALDESHDGRRHLGQCP